MQVQVNTGNGLAGKETLESWATSYLNDSLSRFSHELTRVEMQLSDEARGKSGPADMRCTLEARLTGHTPIAVTHDAKSSDEAIRGAAQKLIHSLDRTFGKLDRHEHRARDTIRKDALPTEPVEGDVPR